MNLGEVAADLYGRTPAEFVAARTEHARAAENAGEKELAGEIAALRKPTTAAWAVNMLVRAAPDEVAALLRLGEDLRTAQRKLSGKQLRSLTVQRRQVVDALAQHAGAVAADNGQRVSAGVLRQVGETLTAALAEPEVADRVRSGTLVSASNYEGFGPVGPDLTVIREDDGVGTAARKRDARPKTPGARKGGEQAEQEARRRAREDEELRAAHDRARAAVDSAERGAEQAAEELRHNENRLERLRGELAAAEEQLRFAREADRAARAQVRTAREELDRVQRRLP